ncbi:MAG: AAA domain-containing protein, partial [Clostridia bacterium]
NQPVMLNKALILAYTKERDINSDNLIQEFEPLAEDAFSHPYDVIDYLNSKGFKFRYIKRKGLIPFDLPADYRTDGLEIKNMAVLGRFPLANSIYNDYLALEKYNLTSPSIDALLNIQKKKMSFKERRRIQKKREPASFYEIHDLDYAQERALEEINRKENVVIYGPPGTGKSQTIVNVISDALCKQKRVLVVSQKRAALDVVFNRLGKLSSKVIMIPDPEKDKFKFFERVKAMHEAASATDYDENKKKHSRVELNIKEELDTLQKISDTLFNKTEFGLTRQEMYAASYNIGKDTSDYKFYEQLKKTPIVRKNYPELRDDLTLITDKSLVSLYIAQRELIKENEMVRHILPNIDMHQLKEAQAFLYNTLSKSITPFDTSKYPYSRYLTTFYLEQAAPDRRSIRNVASIITDIEHPNLSKMLKVSAFPLFWIMFPFLKLKYDEFLEDIKIDLNIAKAALDRYQSEYNILNKVLDPEGFALAIGGLINGNTAFLQKLASALDNYVKVRDMQAALSSLSDGVKLLLDFAYENSDHSLYSMELAVGKILPIRIYHEIISNDIYVEEFLSKTVTFDDLRNRILALKTEQRGISRLLAFDSFTKTYIDHIKNAPESKDFLYEIQKQRALKPIRVMFEYFEDYLMKLFPCWLLSPEVVSTILPLKADMFDLVVFDEASQIFIESALPAIYRGSRVVVAGDNKQLRPTAGFVKRYFGDDSLSGKDLAVQAALEVESLLDLATARYSPVYLSYHYRSNFAELIDFSNAAFYDNKLQIAPNIVRKNGVAPIERIKVKGQWQNRRNHEEAAAVVKLVRTILREREYNESIGIVTFNVEQKEYIEDLLDAECDKVKIFARQYAEEQNRVEDGESRGIFVKNLENVQGEERDIIIFSIGYAKNENDRVVAQFGSLSMEGGENRLNVAVTRAKKKVYVVTSIEPEELDRSQTAKNNGPKLLKKYLHYVRAVSDCNYKEVKNILSSIYTERNEIDPVGAYEAQIKSALEALGYTVDINLGNTKYKLSLGVFDKELNRYVLGIECDYQAFYSSPSVLERDVYRIKFLESRGWKIVRVWSRDWWLSRKRVLDSLIAAIEKEKSLIKEAINRS